MSYEVTLILTSVLDYKYRNLKFKFQIYFINFLKFLKIRNTIPHLPY